MDRNTVISKVQKKLSSCASEYLQKADYTQDSEEAKHFYEMALKCSDITPAEKKECEENIKEIRLKG